MFPDKSTICTVDYRGKSTKASLPSSIPDNGRDKLVIAIKKDSEITEHCLLKAMSFVITVHTDLLRKCGITAFSVIELCDPDTQKQCLLYKNAALTNSKYAIRNNILLKTRGIHSETLYSKGCIGWDYGGIPFGKFKNDPRGDLSYFEGTVTHVGDYMPKMGQLKIIPYIIEFLIEKLTEFEPSIYVFKASDTESRVRFTGLQRSPSELYKYIAPFFTQRHRSGNDGFIHKAILKSFKFGELNSLNNLASHVMINISFQFCNPNESENTIFGVMPSEIIDLRTFISLRGSDSCEMYPDLG